MTDSRIEVKVGVALTLVVAMCCLAAFIYLGSCIYLVLYWVYLSLV